MMDPCDDWAIWLLRQEVRARAREMFTGFDVDAARAKLRAINPALFEPKERISNDPCDNWRAA